MVAKYISLFHLPFTANHAYARSYKRHGGAIDRTICCNTGMHRGVDGGADDCVWWLPARLKGLMVRVTSPTWAWHGCRLGAMGYTIPTKQPASSRQCTRDAGRPGGMSTFGVDDMFPDPFSDYALLDKGVVSLSDLCCTGFSINMRALRGYTRHLLYISSCLSTESLRAILARLVTFLLL